MHPLKLVYAHPVAIPGQAANTVQIVKACSAFEAAGCRVIPRREGSWQGGEKSALVVGKA